MNKVQQTSHHNNAHTTKRVGLMITCLIDFIRPNIAYSAIQLIEEAGYHVDVPLPQSCCGQVGYNSGDNKDTIAIAKQTIAAFEKYDYVVAASGSCAGMIKCHYPSLFKNDPDWFARAALLASKTFELTSFLIDEAKITALKAQYPHQVTYHDSCAGLRELQIYDQPRKLLSMVEDLELIPLKDANVCCGFGGTFCVKYPDISNKMVTDKSEQIIATGAHTLAAGDLGCLMNMAGKLSRLGSSIKVYHIAEILSGRTDCPPIAQSQQVSCHASR